MAANTIADVAIKDFASRSHNAWRRQFLRDNPKERGRPRMRMREDVMVDINRPWKDLDPKAKVDNLRAARAAYSALKRYPNDREKASAYIHTLWVRRNRNDPSQSKALFRPYSELPEVEKDKDRLYVNLMRKSLAAARRRRPRAPRRVVRKKRGATLRVDARSAARLKAAAGRLSTALGRKITAQALLTAGVEAVLAACESPSRARSKKKR